VNDPQDPGPPDGTAPAIVRQMRSGEVAEAERIMRIAFGTFLGFPDPALFGGDSDVVGSRFRADPSRAFALEQNGNLIGSNLVSRWGSFGFFGPVSIDPSHWGQGLAPMLVERAVTALDGAGCRHTGLYTFAQSPKHHALYERFGFFPRYLTPLLARPVPAAATGQTDVRFTRYGTLSGTMKAGTLQGCRELTDAIDEGLDVSCEIEAVANLGLGETLLLHDDVGLASFAVCHYGPATEAGSGNCYVKFAAVRGGPTAPQRLNALLAAVEFHAASVGATVVLAGVNTARSEAYTTIKLRGYVAQVVGVAMQRPLAEGFNRRGVFILDDWR